MTVSFGAVLLLPFSIISNEVLLRYPQSYYIKWLNDSLIQGMNVSIWMLSVICNVAILIILFHIINCFDKFPCILPLLINLPALLSVCLYVSGYYMLELPVGERVLSSLGILEFHLFVQTL